MLPVSISVIMCNVCDTTTTTTAGDLSQSDISSYCMVDEQMKVLWSLNNTSYLVTGLFDQVISNDRSSLII